MKRLIGLLLLCAPLAFAQPSNPSVRDSSTDPTGVACTSAAPILRYTSGGTSTMFACTGSGGTVYAAIGGGGTPLPANARGALNNNGSGTLEWVPPYAVDVTQAPYSAVCDGTTDDHVAIQAAIDNNAAIFIPWSSGGTACNVGTVGVTISPSGFAFYGNGQYLKYLGTASALTVSGSHTVFDNNSVVRDLIVDMTGSTGTPTAFDLTTGSQIELDNDADYNGPTGYIGLNLGSGNNNSVKNYFSGGSLIGSSSSSNVGDTVIGSLFGGGNLNGTGYVLSSSAIANLTIGDTLTSSVFFDYFQGNVILGAHVSSASGLIEQGILTGTATSGVVSVSGDKTYVFGQQKFPSITGIGSAGALCVDASGNVAVSTNNTGVGAPCP